MDRIGFDIHYAMGMTILILGSYLYPSALQITEKCLPPILELEHLEDLVLEGCRGIDDDGAKMGN